MATQNEKLADALRKLKRLQVKYSTNPRDHEGDSHLCIPVKKLYISVRSKKAVSCFNACDGLML